MQQSMTGFGRSECFSQQFLIKCEIKTLNSKFFDFSPRIPKELNDREPEIRTMALDSLKRGKIMFTLEIDINSDTVQLVHVDEKLFLEYYKKFKELSELVNAKNERLVKIALESPDVIKQQDIQIEEIVWEDVKKTIQKSIEKCIDFRRDEGESTESKLNEYVRNIRKGLETVEQFDEERTDNIRAKLKKSLDELRDKVKPDENRFEQELIFYLERFDISEEKVRLAQHLDYFNEIIHKEEAAGKKLGFVAQEIGREVNTIGSKANDANIQRIVVEMKDDLEKIKEQALNII
ncbi:MAG: YicC family protein [Ekhidna sp.]|nr:YicC family protein [Ekhidna sp.]